MTPHLYVARSYKIGDNSDEGIAAITAPRNLLIALAEEEMIAEFVAALHPVRAPLESVVRKYRCLDCGHRHVDGVEVTLDEPTVKGMVTGYWCCDECGSDFWDNVRVTDRDHR